jgi:hypothetical protein
MRKGVAIALALSAVAALAAAPADARIPPEPAERGTVRTIEVPVPGPGKLRVATFVLAGRWKSPSREGLVPLPKRVVVANEAELPDSLSLVYAVKRAKPGKNRFVVEIVALSPDRGPAARQAAPDGPPVCQRHPPRGFSFLRLILGERIENLSPLEVIDALCSVTGLDGLLKALAHPIVGPQLAVEISWLAQTGFHRLCARVRTEPGVLLGVEVDGPPNAFGPGISRGEGEILTTTEELYVYFVVYVLGSYVWRLHAERLGVATDVARQGAGVPAGRRYSTSPKGWSISQGTKPWWR